MRGGITPAACRATSGYSSPQTPSSLSFYTNCGEPLIFRIALRRHA
jgi:hypothetical protein